MEVPTKLKNLYKHWEKHTKSLKVNSKIDLPSDLQWFITERMRIWEKKYLGKAPPYTDDKILQKYKFCNIYRELDRQTIEIHTDLKPLLNDFPLWLLNLCFYRLVCSTQTIRKVGRLNLDADNNKVVFDRLLSLPKPKYGSAYVFPISVIQKSKYPTREEFFCFYLPKVIPEVAREIEKMSNTTVNRALDIVLPKFSFNFKFHWTEILIDIAYQFPGKIDLFKDFYVGPGALPTAKYLSPKTSPTEAVNKLVGIKLDSFPYLTYNSRNVELSAENWEGIFCEYRKYRNLKSEKGRIRKFHGEI